MDVAGLRCRKESKGGEGGGNEVDQRIIGCEHEGVDHDVGALAFVDFLGTMTPLLIFITD